jgi:hypothetical protein
MNNKFDSEERNNGTPTKLKSPIEDGSKKSDIISES